MATTESNIAAEARAASSTQPKLQWFNIANLVAYVANAAVTFGVGLTGVLGPTNAQLSAKYQTLVTPAGYAFSIWGVIFIAQFIWAVAQMLPLFRSKPLVVHGVGFSYLFVCLAQIAWTFLFTLQYITASLVAMIFILIPLINIIASTSRLTHEGILHYFLLKFPFEIHGGWIMAATVVNSNVVLVADGFSTSIQAYVAWASLAVLAMFAIYYSRTYVVAIVIAWASFAIAVELKHPTNAIAMNFSAGNINWVKRISEILALSILVSVVIQLIMSRMRGRQPGPTIRAPETTTAEPTSYTSMEH